MSTEVAVCGGCSSPVEYGDLRCAVCYRPAPHVPYPDRPHTVVEILRCDGCGAAISYSVAAKAPECAFCGSRMHVEQQQDPMEQTEHYLPFTVDLRKAREAVWRWTRSLGWFRPSGLRSRRLLDGVYPLRWPAWVFDAEALISWAAESDRGGTHAPWTPHLGQLELEFDDVIAPATRGFVHAETERLVKTYDLATATRSADIDPSGTFVERFDVPRSFARRHLTWAIGWLAARRLRSGIIPGSRHRNVHTEVVLKRLATRRFSLPCYVLPFSYQGKPYRVVLSGQDESCLIGEAPYSPLKIAFAAVGVFVLLILFAVVFALFAGGP